VDEKRLITAFFLGNAIDSTSTSILLTQKGWQELNQFVVNKIAMGEFHDVLILKLALTAVLIGTFALATCIESRWAAPIGKALRIGNLLVWGTQIWNGINLLATILSTTA
jgi:hypothetical protein